MAWNEGGAIVRERIQCSMTWYDEHGGIEDRCMNTRLLTVYDNTESAARAHISYEKKNGWCKQCEHDFWEELEQLQAGKTKPLRFAKCPLGMCGKVMPMAVLPQHIEEHERDKRVMIRKVFKLSNGRYAS